jgi:hypothetical protein
VAPPQWGPSSIDCQDGVFPQERHCIAPVWAFVKLCTPGEGPEVMKLLIMLQS